MKTVTILTYKSNAVNEWMRKEEGSFEDHGRSSNHVYALLQRFGGKVSFTEEEAKTIITSGKYQSTGWNEDEIEGGLKTMKTIASYVQKLEEELKEK